MPVTDSMKSIIKSCIKGLYVFDAVASPAHWFYDRNALRSTYGKIEGYVKPTEKMRGSIMSLSNTGGAGRGSDEGNIVGDVILHDKKKYWGRGADFHYHVTLSAGENTLEGSLVRVLVRTLASSSNNANISQDLNTFRSNYVDFMTTPGTHNDSYASTCHRMFFANKMKGLKLEDCPDNDNHNVDSMDALTLTIPVILKQFANANNTDEDICHSALSTIKITRNVSHEFERYCNAFTTLLLNVLRGDDLRDSVKIAANLTFQNGGNIIENIVKRGDDDPMVACYIDSGFPAMLFMLYKYADNDMATVALANANAGGENVARGSCLGAVLGARSGAKGICSGWTEEGLVHKDEINAEIDAFVSNL
jgi:ADP-ribosyl-[dinitrogen reductase] hydrolase